MPGIGDACIRTLRRTVGFGDGSRGRFRPLASDRGALRDEVGQPRNGGRAGHAETVGETVAEGDPELSAGLQDPETRVPGLASRLAPGAGRELPPRSYQWVAVLVRSE